VYEARTRTDRPVAFLPAMRDSRKTIEVDWRTGRPIATSTRIGIGDVTGKSLSPPACGELPARTPNGFVRANASVLPRVVSLGRSVRAR